MTRMQDLIKQRRILRLWVAPAVTASQPNIIFFRSDPDEKETKALPHKDFQMNI